MKKQSPKQSADEMQSDYSQYMTPEHRKPNRFAGVMTNAPCFVLQPDGTRHELRTVELDEEVAKFFPTSESINAVLRAIVHAVPQQSSSHV